MPSFDSVRVDNQDQKVVALINYGGAIGGAATGAALGFLAGGPIGAAIGGAFGAAVQGAASEVAHRELSRREKMRVGATISYAVDFIRERLSRGDAPRSDGFFQTDESNRSPAEEIFEGALLKMKNEHEERKARFYGQFFARVSFDSTCSPDEANYLLHVLDSLTFLQLSLISLFGNTAQFPNLPTNDYAQKNVTGELSNVLAATFELCQSGLVLLRNAGEANGTVVLDPGDIEPAHMTLRLVGRRLYELAGLAAIAESNELAYLAKLMSSDTDEEATVTINRSLLRNR
jgi:hypothetical protein